MKGQDLKREIMKKYQIKDSDIRKWPKYAKQIWDSFQTDRFQIMSEFETKLIPLRERVIEEEDKLVRKFMERLCSASQKT